MSKVVPAPICDVTLTCSLLALIESAVAVGMLVALAVDKKVSMGAVADLMEFEEI